MNGINFTRLKFIGFFAAAVFLCVIIFSSFWGPIPSLPPQENRETLAIKDPVLQQQIVAEPLASEKSVVNLAREQQIQDLQIELAAKNAMMEKLQNELKNASVKNNSALLNEQKMYNGKLTDLQNDLQVKAAVIDQLKSQVASFASKGNTTLDEQKKQEKKIRDLQYELQGKTASIAKLESQVKSVPTRNDISSTAQKNLEKKVRDLQNDIQAKTFTISKLQNQLKASPLKPGNDVASKSSKDVKKMEDEIEFLKWALRSEVSSNHALTSSINKLKQANASLNNQLSSK